MVENLCKAGCSSTRTEAWCLPLRIHNPATWTSLGTSPWALMSDAKSKEAKAVLLSPHRGPDPAHRKARI